MQHRGPEISSLEMKGTKKPLISEWLCGRNRTRTCDPIDVNDVLYQLSHATLFGWLRFLSATNKIIAWFRRYVKGFFLFFCQPVQNTPAIFISPSRIIAPPPMRRICS